jgi:hypothetical protein
MTGKATTEQKNLISQAYRAIFDGNAEAFRRYTEQAGIGYDMSVRPLLSSGEDQSSSESGSNSGGTGDSGGGCSSGRFFSLFGLFLAAGAMVKNRIRS